MNPIYTGFISGLVTALSWAVLAVGYNYIRNLWLEHKLKNAFKLQGRGYSVEGFTVSVNNRTSIPVIVRQVKLYESYPSSSVRLVYFQANSEVIGERTLKNIGDKETEKVYLVPFHSQPTERSFIELPAHTGASWIVPNKMMREIDWTFAACRVVIEYTTVFGNRKVIAVFATEDSVKYMTRDYQMCRSKIVETSALPPK
jgi:hypothetical protein